MDGQRGFRAKVSWDVEHDRWHIELFEPDGAFRGGWWREVWSEAYADAVASVRHRGEWARQHKAYAQERWPSLALLT